MRRTRCHRRDVRAGDQKIAAAQGTLLVDARSAANLHSGAMPDLFFSCALLPEGWAEDVRVTTGEDGALAAVVPGAPSEGAEAVAGVDTGQQVAYASRSCVVTRASLFLWR